MKLSALLLITAILQVSASSFAQKITLSETKAPIQKVFDKISTQTGLDFLFPDDILKDARPISITVKDADLKAVLDKIFNRQPLEYSIEDKSVVVSRKSTPLLDNLKILFSIPKTVSGKITDTTGMALAGATIKIKSTNATVLSDMNGEFSIITQVGDELMISYTGFITQTIVVAENTPRQNIVMRMASSELSEVVISTGYQNISRERMTGSYASITAKRLSNKLQPSLMTALEGQAAGVVVTKEGKIEIRGKSTYLGNAEPLIVLDGYTISSGLESINIDNVESITVLKDAVAASIYGARSSNGVIVITTKNAKKGKVEVGYKGSTGVTLRPDLSYLDRTNAADYVDAEIAVYNVNPAQAQSVYDYYGIASRVNQLLVSKDRGVITEAQMNAELSQLRNNDGIGQLEKYLLRSKITQQHNLSFSAGNEKSMTNAALRYIGNRNNSIGNEDSRVIFDLKNDWKLAHNITVKMFSNINFSNSSIPVRTATELLAYSPISSLLQPYSLIVDPATGQPQNVPVTRPTLINQYAAVQGLKPTDYNPLNDLLLETTQTQNFQARLGGSISVNILDGLSAEIGGAWTRGSGFNRTIYDADSYRTRMLFNGTTSISNPTKHYIPDGSIVDESRNINEAYTLRGQVNFNKIFSTKHRVNAIIGSEINKDILDNNVYPTRYAYNDQAGSFSTFNYTDYNGGLYNADFQFPGAWSQANNGSYAFRDNRFVSLYANGSYEYDNRFILSGSARIDQTNFFGTNPKYRYKPNWSIGGTYKLAEEKFFNVPWIDKLNIRGSYGINGNISLKQGPYLLLSVGAFSTISGGVPYGISSPPNPDLRWERTLITNLGVDLSFFKGRLNASVDYYNKLSKDLLAPDFVDPTYGRTSIVRNAGAARNTGIELSLESDVVKMKDFNWNVFFNGSYNASKVIAFNYNYLFTTNLTLSPSTSSFGVGGGASLKNGYPLDAIFSYAYAGLDNTGTSTYYTSENTKVLGGNVAVKDLVYSGTVRPKYVLNFTNTFTYQRFDLSFMLTSQLGGVFRRDTYTGNNYNNKYVAQRWRKPGDEANTIYPKLNPTGTELYYFPFADIMVESADYVKLRDLTLGYTLNNKLWHKSGINNVKLYFQGRNLLMVTANKDHIDPETMMISDGGSITRTLPLRPELYMGLSLNF